MHPARGATIWTESAEASGGELDLQITASNRSDPESPTGRTLTLATAVMTPVSVGNVRLGSREPRDAPIIDFWRRRKTAGGFSMALSSPVASQEAGRWST